MGLKELDKEYRDLSDKSSTAQIDYCEKLIERLRGRLTDDYSDTNHIRALILEMIENAEKEIITLKGVKKKK